MSSEDCSASGVLPYLYKNNELYIMLGLEGRGLSDFGGFSDGVENAFDNASREFSEETMGLFCVSHGFRGNKDGVLKSSITMKSILAKLELHNLLVKKVTNPSNRYQMFIAPVAQWITSEEFEKTIEINDQRMFGERIRSVEKRTVQWYTADQLIDALNDFNPKLKVNGFTEKVFTQFRKTVLLRESIDFIRFLQRQDPATQTPLIQKLWEDS